MCRRLSHTPLQSRLINSHFQHLSIKALVLGLTFYRKSCDNLNTLADGPAAPPALKGAQGTQRQSEMKALVEEKLNRATYYANLTTEDGVLYADPRMVKAVTNSLRTTFNAITSRGNSESFATNPQFLSKGFACESQLYRPLIHLLNKIIGTTNQHIPPVESQLAKLSFHTFRREIKGTYGSQKG